MIRNRAAGPAVMNALQIGTDSEGGYLVPDEYERTQVQGLEEENVLRSLCTVIQTSSGDRKIPIVASHGTGSRVNSTTAKQPRALENTGLSDGQPICEVTVSYADEPDLGAVADVLDLLTHANYGR